ncbi:MAG TPA: excinuclease ABC subunit UvrC [Thermotogota bacterium]|nr:excinuclease ABC subunit UvrC [Thermotogota bacterium]HPJ89439.1 excinuclease ABC subunit UvrC [Thermotogota bacterium]HPR95264.1 excinuclease ABC subunit UvrC [Thermotogota bacterium]
MNEQIKEHPLKKIAAEFPDKPGVYIFEKKGKPVYIGKAISLKKRIQSYFRETLPPEKSEREKILGIRKDAETLRHIIVEDEKNALLLESRLIYEYKPKYNTFLKDNRFYPYLHVTDEEFPRMSLVRNRTDKGTYYGPFTSAKMLREIMEIVYKTYGIRPCDYDLKKIKKPCLEYQLGRCSAPCTEINKEEYAKKVEKVKVFLEGDVESMKEVMRDRMTFLAGNQMYEQAAKIRDLILETDRIFTPQYIVLKDRLNRDFFALDILEGKVTVIRMKKGAIFAAITQDVDETLSIEEFFSQFYFGKKNDLPDKIICTFSRKNEKKFKELLTVDYFGPPETEPEKELMKMAQKNLEKELESRKLSMEALKQLKTNLGLKRLPKRIEGIDIAHTQGLYTVASVVSFLNGKPDKQKYRKYRITTLETPDDFESMRIVIRRRFSKHPLPDLLLIDGGAGQVSAVKGVLEDELNITEYDMIGLAKAEETIVFPDERGELKLKHTSPSLRVLVAVRDESHRFANTFHSQLRDKRMGRSILEKIPGVGSKRKMQLLKTFGSVKEIRNATVEEIKEIVRNEELAVQIKQFLEQNL